MNTPEHFQALGRVRPVNGRVRCWFQWLSWAGAAVLGQHSPAPPSVARHRRAPAASLRGVSTRVSAGAICGGAAGGVGRWARPPMTLAALAPPCGIGSSSWNQLADRRWLSGSRAPPSWMPVGSPTNDPDGALIVPWVSHAASPSTLMAGPEQHRSSLGEAPGLYTPVRDPCVLSVQGVATPPQQSGIPLSGSSPRQPSSGKHPVLSSPPHQMMEMSPWPCLHMPLPPSPCPPLSPDSFPRGFSRVVGVPSSTSPPPRPASGHLHVNIVSEVPR